LQLGEVESEADKERFISGLKPARLFDSALTNSISRNCGVPANLGFAVRGMLSATTTGVYSGSSVFASTGSSDEIFTPALWPRKSTSSAFGQYD